MESDLDNINNIIKPLEDYTNEDKILCFDKLYYYAKSIFDDAISNGYLNEDDPHYAYEELMMIIARDRNIFWKHFNSTLLPLPMRPNTRFNTF